MQPAELLFAIHTYYAVFMKLLTSEVMAFFHSMPTPLSRMLSASTAEALRSELADLEAGGIFSKLNITNFLEGGAERQPPHRASDAARPSLAASAGHRAGGIVLLHSHPSLSTPVEPA